MTPSSLRDGRTIGLFGATAIGVGAIVGGGILAISGAAFALTGPGALLAFALNGLVAVATALSFAEMSGRFPESGGSYTFAKKVLSVESAFLVGWVVWMASIVAAVLYALGFGAFLVMALDDVLPALGIAAPAWLGSTWAPRGAAVLAALAYAAVLTRRSGGSGALINVVKVAVFGVLIAGGLAAMVEAEPGTLGERLTPFLAGGTAGLFGAMGVTFIALQGFDLIAAAAGEIREPARTIPRAMLLSLGAALAIYLPLLLVVSAVGVEPGSSIAELARQDPEGVVALAAERFLGPFGYWLVVVAGLLAMLSALEANLFAASRVARAMARDRTLPGPLARIHPVHGTPARALWVGAGVACLLLLALADVATAGGLASLVFLVSFALAHGTTLLARRRGGPVEGVPLARLPVLPVAGGLACAALAVYQGLAEPASGALGLGWLLLGGGLYLALFRSRARVVDAAAEGRDPQLARLRGRSPLVLVPVANPASTRSMVALADALAPPVVGRVLLLSVVHPPERAELGEADDPEARRAAVDATLTGARDVLGEALEASFALGVHPTTLTTIAPDPWPEIARTARRHDCACVVLGLPPATPADGGQVRERAVERLIGTLDCDVAVLRAPQRWDAGAVRRVLVPVAGDGGNDVLRARVLGSLQRTAPIHVTYLRLLGPDATDEDLAEARDDLRDVAYDELGQGNDADCVAERTRTGEDPATAIAVCADDHDLALLGIVRVSRRKKLFGSVALEIARTTDTALVLISRRG